jgi:1-acyl-sn-glycerol-3-phosphate acyltransferase
MTRKRRGDQASRADGSQTDERSFYRLANRALRLVIPLLARLRVEGSEHVPATGALIVAINHASLVDPPLVGAILPRQVRPMAKQEALRVPVVGWIIRAYGAFPVRRGQPDRRSLRTALEILEAGGVVMIAPEGTRSRSGRLQASHAGVGHLALLSDAPVLPVAIIGTHSGWRQLARLRRAEVTVRIGQPLVTDLERSDTRAARRMTGMVMQAIAALLPPDMRGDYTTDPGEVKASDR